jgi:hypothetical protein
MRDITLHHDGHGLNDLLTISADDLGPGGASHVYLVQDADRQVVAQVKFQHGPRQDPASIVGCTEAVLLAILIDRLTGFQAGPFACRENAIQLTKLEETLMWTRKRADDRAARGVLGKNEQ